MVLELRRPVGHTWSALLAIWPGLLSYIISFVYVGIYWNNHHHLFQVVRQIKGGVLWANSHLLFWLSLFPFMTNWAGESHFAAVPMSCYAFVSLMAAVAYAILSAVIIRVDPSHHVLSDALGSDFKGKASILAFLLAVIFPFFGPFGVTLAGVLMVTVALVWLLPDRRVERALERKERS